MRSSFFRKLRFAVITAITIVLVLLAVGLSVARVLIVYAPDFRAELESTLAEVLQRPLTVGGLRAEWVGRHPKLILQNVRLTGGPAAGLAVDELEVSIDLLASLRDRRLQPAEVAVSGLRLTVVYGADGSLKLTRIGDGELPAMDLSDGGDMPALPAQVHLRSATLELVDALSNRSHRFPQVDLWLSAKGDTYSLAGYLELPSALGRSARFRAEWRGLPEEVSGLDGRMYVDARELNLETVSALLQRLSGMPQLSGRSDGELWLDVARGRLTRLGGRVQATNVRARAAAGAAWQSVAGRLGGRFQWQRGDRGWQLDAQDIEYVSDYRVWPKNQLSLRLTEQENQSLLEGSTGYIRLDDLAPVLGLLPALPESARQRLSALKPVGEIQAPRGHVAWNAEGLTEYGLQAHFTGLGISADDGIPGFAGFDGQLAMREDGGAVRLESHRGQVDFHGLFREPIPIRSLRAELGWQIDSEGWRLEAPLLKVENEDARALARLRLFSDGGGLPMIDLRAHVSDGNGAMTSRYLPAGILGKELLHWLDTAIRSGDVPRADIALFGRLNRFPFDDGSGVFDVQADVARGILNYQPGWPGIEDINGRLRFYGATMDITADHGRIGGARVEQARVSLANFSTADLRIEGRVRGEGKDLLGFLRESPLGASIRDELAALSLSGVHDLSLQADIPVQPERDTLRVAGTVNLRQGRLSAPDWNLALSDLQGPVRFTERGVSAPAISGRYRGQNISLSAETGTIGRQERIRVTTRLRASPQALLGMPALPGVSGEADWNLELLLPGFQAGASVPPMVLRLESELRGIAVDLPDPMAKPAAEPRALAIELRATRGGMAPVAISYGHDLHALLALGKQMTLQKAALEFGSGEPRLPAARGLQVGGSIDVLDLDAWQPRLRALTEGGGATAAKRSKEPGLPLLGLDLNVGRMRLLGQEFSQTGLRINRTPRAWQLAFSGPDLAGQVLVPDEAAAITKIELERLRLRSGGLDGGGDGGGGGVAADASSAGTLSPLDLNVADLLFDRNSLGRLQLRLRRGPEGRGMRLESAHLQGPMLDAQAQGGWTQTQTELVVNLSSINAGKALGLFGYPDALHGGLADGSVTMNWPGSPAEFDIAKLSGAIDLSVMNGRVLSVEPGPGRLFGLLSIAELPRRLSLNFSDLFGDGFAFDRIEAHLRMESGDAYTRLFYMQGPAARVDLDGRIGLASRDYDQRVTVTPQISTALPAIGAIAGGPAGAAVMFITQKLLEKQLNKLTRFRYRVTGDWDEPEIETLDRPADVPPANLEGSPAQ